MGEQTTRCVPGPADEPPTILVVDDEPTTLQTLHRQISRDYPVLTAPDAHTALRILAGHPPIAVVVSDLWMPQLDGIRMLGQVRTGYPHTTRVLLTAHADLDTAIAAINDGQIFRFLVKPCPVAEMRATIRDAVEHHRLAVAESRILDSTLRASMQAIFDCMELANPQVFARAGRIRNLVRLLRRELGLPDAWEIEVAAMASQLGAVTLPPEVLAKLDDGRQLTVPEQQMVDALPAVAQRLLHRIPRLDDVVAIVRGLLPDTAADTCQVSGVVARGVELIRTATAFETMHARGVPPAGVIAALAGTGACGTPVLDALRRVYGPAGTQDDVRPVPVGDLRVGMRVMEDLRTDQGLVLIGRGMVVTEVMLNRLANFTRACAHAQPVLAALPPDERAGIRTRLVELLEEATDDDVAFVRHLVEAFLASARQHLDGLRAAVAGGDAAAVAHRAHALRGAATNLGARHLADGCEVVEQLVEGGLLDQVPRQLDRLTVALDQAPVTFAAVLEQLTPAAASPAG